MALGLLGGLALGLAGRYGLDKYYSNQHQTNMGMLDNALSTARQGLLSNPEDPNAIANYRNAALSYGLDTTEIDQRLRQFGMGVQDPTTLQRQFEYYQGLPGDQQQGLLDYRRAGAINVNLGQGGVGIPLTSEQKAAAGFSPQAVVVPDRQGIPRVVSKEQFSQPQIQSGGFATRMSTASGEINDIYTKYPNFDPAGLIQNIEEFTPIPSVLANFAKSPEGQRFRQAQDNWISANLRKESGAAIPVEELENERRKWFPMPGDSQAVIEQKARARRDAELTMIKASGGAFQDLEDQADMEELMRLRQEQNP